MIYGTLEKMAMAGCKACVRRPMCHTLLPALASCLKDGDDPSEVNYT